MQADYRKELSRNFMILNCHFDESAENYQLRTLLTNRIRGLMPFALEHVDNQQKCRYEITGFVSFATCCESFELSLEDLKKIYCSLLDLLGRLEDYLLDPDHLLLEPEFLYIDWTAKELKAAYLPVSSGPVRESLCRLTEYMITQAACRNKDSVLLLCRVLDMLRDNRCPVESLRSVLSGSSPDFDTQAQAAENAFSGDRITSLNDFPEPDLPDLPKEPLPSGKRFAQILPERYTLILAAFMAAAAAVVWTALRLQDSYILTPYEMAAASALGAVLIFLCAFITEKIARKTAPARADHDIGAESAAFREESRSPFPETDYTGWADHFDDSVFSWTEGRLSDHPDPDETAGQTVLLSGRMPQAGSIPASLVPADRTSGLPPIVLDERDLLIGQKESLADRVIPDPTVSRVHAKITVRNGRYSVIDMGSKNGTNVDGKPAVGREELPLTDGSRIMFAGCEYIFHEGKTVVN